MSKNHEFLPNLTTSTARKSFRRQTMIHLTEDQLQSLSASMEHKPPSAGTFQAHSTCNFSIKEESEKFIYQILQGVTNQPESVRNGYKYKKNESFSIGDGDLNVGVNINYKHRLPPPPPTRNATLIRPR